MRFQIGLMCLTAVFTVSCQDLSTDEWCRKKLEQDAAKLQDVSGSYSGTLVSGQDGSSMGNLTVEVGSEIVPGAMKNCTASDVGLVAKGRIMLVQGTAKLLSFSDGKFNSESGALSADIKRPNVLGEEAHLMVSGTLENDLFTGHLEAQGYPEGGGTFTLKRSGPVVSSLPSAVVAGSTGPGLVAGTTVSHSYNGQLRYTDGTEENAQLILLTVDGSAGEEFFYTFLPAKPVQVTIKLGPGVQVAFPNAQWDTRTGRLRGAANGQTVVVGGPAGGSSQYQISLDCFQTTPGAPSGWTCHYYSNQSGLLFVGTFTESGSGT